VTIPDAPYVHLFIADGAFGDEAQSQLTSGDAARLAAAGTRRVTATESAEILIWEMHATLDHNPLQPTG
jgi:hypothetical protein